MKPFRNKRLDFLPSLNWKITNIVFQENREEFVSGFGKQETWKGQLQKAPFWGQETRAS